MIRCARGGTPWGVAALLLIAMQLPAEEVDSPEVIRAYVTDELEVTLREGAGTTHEIARMVSSGTEVVVLERGGRWTRVQTPDGAEGWILSRYLEEEPVGRFRTEQLQHRLRMLQGENASLRLEIHRAGERLGEAESRIRGLREENDLLSERLNQASEGLRLREENEALHEDNERLRERIARQQDELRELREHTVELASRDRKEWFVVGAGVLLAGVVMGMIVGSFGGRRRRDRWSRL